jgi:hypothetical protein
MVSVTMRYNPMPLVRLAEPFDHPDWLFELKHDGFRALAHIEDHQPLVSRRGRVPEMDDVRLDVVGRRTQQTWIKT